MRIRHFSFLSKGCCGKKSVQAKTVFSSVTVYFKLFESTSSIFRENKQRLGDPKESK